MIGEVQQRDDSRDQAKLVCSTISLLLSQCVPNAFDKSEEQDIAECRDHLERARSAIQGYIITRQTKIPPLRHDATFEQVKEAATKLCPSERRDLMAVLKRTLG